jgi:hypothetical protein
MPVIPTIRHLFGGPTSGRDPSAWSLLAANLIAIGLALWERWDLAPLIWIYWSQSCIIGWFNFARILSLKEFSTENFKINNRPAAPTKGTQLFTAFFFLVHYGTFHLVYLVFLQKQRPLEVSDHGPVLICIGIFFVNHLFSFLHNLEGDRRQKRNIGKLMFFPYARIIPMHLTIILGAEVAGGPSVLLLFLILKTVADLVMHGVEHSQIMDPLLRSVAREDPVLPGDAGES